MGRRIAPWRPPGNRLAAGHPGARSPEEAEEEAEQVQFAGRRRSSSPPPPAPRRHQPSNFVSGDQPLSPPSSALAPARPKRPPPAGLRGTWRPESPDRVPGR